MSEHPFYSECNILWSGLQAAEPSRVEQGRAESSRAERASHILIVGWRGWPVLHLGALRGKRVLVEVPPLPAPENTADTEHWNEVERTPHPPSPSHRGERARTARTPLQTSDHPPTHSPTHNHPHSLAHPPNRPSSSTSSLPSNVLSYRTVREIFPFPLALSLRMQTADKADMTR